MAKSSDLDVDREGIDSVTDISDSSSASIVDGLMGVDFARLVLLDPRLEFLSADAIGVYLLLQARTITGHQTPSKSSLAMRALKASSARVLRMAINELAASKPPLIREVDGVYYAESLSEAPQTFLVGKSDCSTSGAAPHVLTQLSITDSGVPQAQLAAGAGAEVVGADLSGQSQIGARSKRCPANDIFELFTRICIDLPTIQPVASWHPQRMTKLEALWKRQPDLQFWEGYFNTVHESDFLCGRAGNTWRADFDWILKLPNFCKIIEQTYRNRGRAKGALFNAGSSARPESYAPTEIDGDNDFAKMAEAFEHQSVLR